MGQLPKFNTENEDLSEVVSLKSNIFFNRANAMPKFQTILNLLRESLNVGIQMNVNVQNLEIPTFLSLENATM